VKSFCGPAACIYPGVTVQEEAACGAICYVPARTVVKTGQSMLGNPGKPISYKNEYKKAPPGNPIVFYSQVSVLALYRNIFALMIIVLFQWLNVTLATKTLLAFNTELLNFEIHSYSLLQVDPLWKFVVMLSVFNFYGGVNGAMLYPIVHFLAACVTKWIFMGRVDKTKVYGHRSWMHARWVLSYQFLNKSIRVNAEFYQNTGWYSFAAKLLGTKVGRNANFKWGWWPEADVCEYDDCMYMDNTVVAYGHNFSKGHLRYETVRIGKGAELQPLSQILPGSECPDGSRVEAKSLLLPIGGLPNCSNLAGNPARSQGRHFVQHLPPDEFTYYVPTPWWRWIYMMAFGKSDKAERESLLPK